MGCSIAGHALLHEPHSAQKVQSQNCEVQRVVHGGSRLRTSLCLDRDSVGWVEPSKGSLLVPCR